MTIKVAAAESEENKALLNDWCKKYIDIAQAALTPLAQKIVSNPEDAIAQVKADLVARLNKNGLSL